MAGTSVALGLILAASIISVLSDDWPQWRGPTRTGISVETGWLTAWPSGGLKQLWKADIGAGYGTVSVSKGKLYTLGNTADEDTVYCLDADTGTVVWKHPYACPAKDPQGYHGPRCTPTVDGNNVYSVSRQGHLFCLDAATGQVKWSKQFTQDFGGKVPTWGYAISALVDGDMLIIEPGGRGASVVALEKASGKVLWQAGDDPASYSSPYPFDFKGQRCVAVFTAPGLVVRNIKDGKELSRFAWKTSWDVNAATPIFTEGRVFISSGYNKGCALLDISENPAKAVWQNKNMRNHCNSCVLWKGFLYGFDENELKCLDLATGETKWAEKRYGKGSLTLVDGKLLLYSDRGKLGLAEASSAGYKELGAFQALQVREYPGKASTDTWANAVLANGKIYCRSQNDLACFDAKGK